MRARLYNGAQSGKQDWNKSHVRLSTFNPFSAALVPSLCPHLSARLYHLFALAYAGVARCTLVLFRLRRTPMCLAFDPAHCAEPMRAEKSRPARSAAKAYARDWLSQHGNGIVMLEHDNEHYGMRIRVETKGPFVSILNK
jgi:hypothetical protein